LTSETAFRLALAAIMLATGGVTLFFRIRASTPGETVSRREEGMLMLISLRLAGLALCIATLAYLISPDSVRWASVPLPLAIRWAAMGLGFVCSILMAWTLASLGKNLTDTVATRSRASLVTTGPYRWVRHPFYTVSALLMLSATLVSTNLLIGLASLVVLGLLATRTPKEDAMLEAKFGQEYINYKKRTPAYLPLTVWTNDGAQR
jgi:protein-S-isoprenylcysteine O-methyltransferase Ste14